MGAMEPLVPGKYHRTYLKAELQTAFEKMQQEKGTASNAYVAAAVRAALEADGYLKPRQDLSKWREKLSEPIAEPVHRRRRR